MSLVWIKVLNGNKYEGNGNKQSHSGRVKHRTSSWIGTVRTKVRICSTSFPMPRQFGFVCVTSQLLPLLSINALIDKD
jgi:ribosomal protein L3